MSEFRRRMMEQSGGGGGDLPAGYTRLEYIKSEGGYIDTGYPIQLGDVIEIDMWATSVVSSAPVLYGYRWAGASKGPNKMVVGIKFDHADALSSYMQIGVSFDATTDGLLQLDQRKKIRIETGDDNHVYIDDVLTYTNSTADAFNQDGSSVYNPYIFTANVLGNNTAGVSKFSRAYEYKVIRGGNIVVWLVPAQRDLDGVNGMYDLVNQIFRTSPNGIAFTSNLDYISPLYPIAAWIGNIGNYRYSASSDGHIGCKLGNTGSAFIWLQDVSQNASTTGSANINNKPKIFSIRQGDSIVFNVKDISKLGAGNIALNVRTTDNGNIGVGTGSFGNTTNKTISATAASNYDVAGVFMWWDGNNNRAICLDVELWVNGTRYI